MVWAFCSQSSRPDSSQNFCLALASDDLLSADTPYSKQIKRRTAGFIRQRMKVSRFRRVKPIRQMVDVFSPPLCTAGTRSDPQWRRKQLRLTIRKQQRGLCGGRTFAISAILLIKQAMREALIWCMGAFGRLIF